LLFPDFPRAFGSERSDGWPCDALSPGCIYTTQNHLFVQSFLPLLPVSPAKLLETLEIHPSSIVKPSRHQWGLKYRLWGWQRTKQRCLDTGRIHDRAKSCLSWLRHSEPRTDYLWVIGLQYS